MGFENNLNLFLFTFYLALQHFLWISSHYFATRIRVNWVFFPSISCSVFISPKYHISYTSLTS